MSVLLSDVADLVDGVLIGNAAVKIPFLSSINDIAPGALVFADNKENLKIAETSPAAAILVDETTTMSSKPLIQVKHPLKAFITLLHYFHPAPKITPGIHPTAVIGEGVHLGENLFIGPYVIIESGSFIGNHSVLKGHVYIGREVTIGEETTIHPHVTIYDQCQIGSRVTIHASTVLGSDGFGYIFSEGRHQKVPHVGRVVIQDDVEVGANTAIDRATMGETLIGQGTKVDNLVQIAHSVKLGKHNILCGFTGIAGSTTTGDHVVFAANVGVSDHVRIDNGVILGARTGVPPRKHLKENTMYLGNPARPKEIALKHELAVNRIPLLRKNIKTLFEELAKLNKKLSELEAQ
jgi:UDP-3-O-[3-hydroxymyristoyl] glucosamine N-acyltransferase